MKQRPQSPTNARRHRTAGALLVSSLLGLSLAHPLCAALPDNAQPVIAEIGSRYAPPSATFPALSGDAARDLEAARDRLAGGDFSGAWSLLRSVGTAAQDRQHPEIVGVGLQIALAQRDTIRAAALLEVLVAREQEIDAIFAALADDPSKSSPLILGPRALAALAHALEAGSAFPDTQAQKRAARLLLASLEHASEDALAQRLLEAWPELGEDEAENPIGEGEADGRLFVGDEPLTLEAALAEITADPLALDGAVTRLLRTARDHEALVQGLTDRGPDPTAVALRAYVLCEMGKPRTADGAIRRALMDAPGSPVLIAARARTLHLLGDYASLRELGTARSTQSAADLELGALLLHAGAAYPEAARRSLLAYQATPADAPAAYRRARRAAEFALADDDPETASELLLAAQTLRPESGNTLRALLALHAPGGAVPNNELYSAASSNLAALGAETYESQLARAARALDRGYADIAWTTLDALTRVRPDDPEPAHMLVEFWLNTDQPGQAERWLRGWVGRRPALSHFRTLLSDVFLKTQRERAAIGILEAWYDDNPGDMAVALQLEDIYRNHVRAFEQAEFLTLRRIRRLPDSLETLRERVRIMSENSDITALSTEIDLLVDLANRAGAAPSPNPGWTRELFENLEERASLRRRDSKDAIELVAKLQADLPGLTPASEAVALRTLARLHEDPMMAIDAVRRAMERRPEVGPRLAIDAANVMLTTAEAAARAQLRRGAAPERTLEELKRVRISAAVDLAQRSVLETLTRASPGLTTEPERESSYILAQAIMIANASLTQSDLDPSHVRTIYDALLDAEEPEGVLNALGPTLPVDQPLPETELEKPEELGFRAHVLSGPFDALGQFDYSDRLSELGLRLAPDEPRINNDYGYRLADRGVRLDEAIAMIEKAVAAEPANASYIDSLGWAQYKKGVLADDDDGKPGAVSNLRRSLDLATAAADSDSVPIIADHLGDALWASGDTALAQDVWRIAEKASRAFFVQMGLRPDAGLSEIDPVFRPWVLNRLAIERKLEAAGNGEEPPIAPPFGPGFAPSEPPDDAD